MTSEDVTRVLEDLIRQFSDPHAFFRELVQNAIDAGSNEVEIEFEYEGDDEETLLTIHVNDFGEGMTREIIETRLTRLFSSTKDDDLTKIGRFGIGFVSVYAIDPDAISVDTARGGECWRVLFKPDRTYELYALQEPIEGTRIRIFKRMTRAEAVSFVARAKKVIRDWCAHVSIPVLVSGQDLRTAFEISAPVQVAFDEPGTRVVAGLVDTAEAFYGYYNHGLTLIEGHNSPWPGMTFRMDSRYLEHTLTRDRVLEDKNFHKAREILDNLYERELPRALLRDLKVEAQKGASARYTKLIAILRRYLSHQPEQLKLFESSPIFIASEGLQTLRQLHRRDKVFVSGGADHLLEFAPHLVGGADPTVLIECLKLAGVSTRLVESEYVLPQRMRLAPQPFVDAVLALGKTLGFAVEAIFVGKFDYAFSPISTFDIFYLHADERSLQAATALSRKDAHPAGFETIIVNESSEFSRDCMKLAERAPELAAMLFIKSLLLPTGMSLNEDDQLLRAATQR